MLRLVQRTNKIDHIRRRCFEALVHVNDIAWQASDARRIGLDHFVGPVSRKTDFEVSQGDRLLCSKLTVHKKGASPVCGHAGIGVLRLLGGM